MGVLVRKCTVLEIEKASSFHELLNEYANESALIGMPSPSAKMETYHLLEAKGALQAFGAFLEDNLVGFITVLSSVLPHYNACTSVAESFFVAKNYRKSGAGTKLRYAAEAHVKAVGSAGLLISAPFGGILAEVLSGAGYTETNRVFFKKVGDV